MAQTTSAINACDAVVKLDNKDSVLANISGSANNVNMDFSNDLGEFKSFGTRWRGRLECGSDASLKLDIIYSQDDAEAMTILREWYFVDRGHKTIVIELPNSAPGGDRFTFEVYLEKLTISAKSDEAGPIMVSCDMKPTGTVLCEVIGS